MSEPGPEVVLLEADGWHRANVQLDHLEEYPELLTLNGETFQVDNRGDGPTLAVYRLSTRTAGEFDAVMALGARELLPKRTRL
jgi:hypothetical protein